jgi:magnesium chelatase family protein
MDLAYIKGQEHVKRALEVAAAGGHNLLMSGPPGSGKTLLARSLPSILPKMGMTEALEVTKVYSVSGLLPSDRPLISQRPFRSPHYTISHAGLVGGGRWPRPGEISLSHRGVLFLDELPEFGHAVLEVLRQPLEDKLVTISRAQGSVTFPANFMMVAAMNPCPCGYYGDPVKQCTCTPSMISRYQKRISGPLLDRIDIFAQVPRIEYEKLTEERLGESSEEVRSRVEEARSVQRERFQGTKLTCNAEMTPVEVKDFCHVEAEAQSLLRAAMKQLALSARAFHRILKLARTIADLAGAQTINASHLAEAIQYRPRTLVQ